MAKASVLIEEEITEEQFREEAPPSPEDALEEILNDNSVDLKEEFDMTPRFKKPWVIQGLKSDVQKTLIERSTRNLRVGNTYKKEVDSRLYSRLVIVYGVVSPNLRDPRVYRKYGLEQGKDDHLLADKIIEYPGYIERLASRILEVSGWGENLVEVAKN